MSTLNQDKIINGNTNLSNVCDALMLKRVYSLSAPLAFVFVTTDYTDFGLFMAVERTTHVDWL